MLSSPFTRIINGGSPARFVWSDPEVVCFLSTAPLRPGHTLVVPRKEIDKWTDLPADLLTHVMAVAQQVGNAAERAFDAPRSALVIAGFEVPHCHVHVSPVWEMNDLNFAGITAENDAAALDDAARRLRAALREQGSGEAVPREESGPFSPRFQRATDLHKPSVTGPEGIPDVSKLEARSGWRG